MCDNYDPWWWIFIAHGYERTVVLAIYRNRSTRGDSKLSYYYRIYRNQCDWVWLIFEVRYCIKFSIGLKKLSKDCISLYRDVFCFAPQRPLNLASSLLLTHVIRDHSVIPVYPFLLRIRQRYGDIVKNSTFTSSSILAKNYYVPVKTEDWLEPFSKPKPLYVSMSAVCKHLLKNTTNDHAILRIVAIYSTSEVALFWALFCSSVAWVLIKTRFSFPYPFILED